MIAISGATVIVPTFNERDNIAELVARVSAALDGRDAEILFVDDSTDDTPRVIRAVAADAPVPVRCSIATRRRAASAAPWSRGSGPPPTTSAS